MRCVIKKAQSFKPEELPVKKTDTPGLIAPAAPSANLDKLNLPGNPFFANPSGPTTPSYFGSTSPTFGLSLETPSPPFTAFQFSISPTLTSFPFIGPDMPTVDTTSSKQPENKKLDTPKPPSTPKLTLVLKRKRDDEYVVKDFQVPDDVPMEDRTSTGTSIGNIATDTMAMMDQSTIDTLPPSLESKLSTDTVSPYSMLTSPYSVQPPSSSMNIDSISMAASGLGGTLPGGMDSVPGAELFELTSGVSDGNSVSDLEGILSSLPGASHLSSMDASLDFDTGLGKSLFSYSHFLVSSVIVCLFNCDIV